MTTDRPQHRGTPTEPVAVTRRRLIAGSGVAAGLAAVGAEHGIPRTGPWEPADWKTDAVHDEMFEVFRAEDALVLRFRLVNMRLYKPILGEAYLRPLGPGPRTLIVDFPPQSIGEQSFDTTDPSETTYDPVPAAGQDLTGNRARAFITPLPTRLAFQIPSGIANLRPALDGLGDRPGLLDWHLFHALTPPDVPPGGTFHPPGELETTIGAPYGLALSTTIDDGWTHSTTPVTHDGRSELWQTRLSAYVDQDGRSIPLSEYPRAAPTVNAVWCTGFSRLAPAGDLPNDTNHFQVPLSVGHRRALVRLTSDTITDGYTPSPVDARRLMLTSAGASLDLHGSWVPPTEGPEGGINMSSWTHHSTLGRDNHVIATDLGYLLPFGHPAVLVTETQRRFEAKPTGFPVANLRTRRYIVVRKHEKYYGTGSTTKHHRWDGRNLPFRRVRLHTTTTPNLTFHRFPTADDPDVTVSGVAFCVSGGDPYLFSLTGWDWAGETVSLNMPLAFVTASAAHAALGPNQNTIPDDLGSEGGSMHQVIAAWNNLSESDPFRSVRLGGHGVALAAERAGRAGESSLRFDRMTFGLVPPDLGSLTESYQELDQPRGNPTMSTGLARIPAVQAVSPGTTSTVWYDDDYVTDDNAFHEEAAFPDRTSVFLLVKGQPLRFAEGGSGVASVPGTHPGVISPNLSVGGISRNRGVVGGPTNAMGNGGVDQFKADAFDPEAFFDGAKLLGGLDLASIIAPSGLDKAPVITTATSGDVATPTLTTRLHWAPDLQPDPAGVFKPLGGSSLRLAATFVTPGDGTPGTSEVSGALRNFTLAMFGGSSSFLDLTFNELSFRARNGGKPTVACDIESVTFGDELSFLSPLEDFLSFGDNGPSIVLKPDSVVAGITLGLPSVGIGIFSLTNLSFTAAVEIPFTAAPARLRFAIGGRERPFHVAVMIFSGGGWFDIAVGSDGVERLEIGIEFGGQFELDLVIASAGIEVMAGFYLAIGKGNGGPGSQAVELSGYFKAHGELNVGPVGASFTFAMGLTYSDDGSGHDPVVWGEVEVSVEVHCLMIGGSVDFHFEKTFAGGGDPTFADMLSSGDYHAYADAFA